MGGLSTSTSVRQKAHEFRREIFRHTLASTSDPLHTLIRSDDVIAAGVRYCGLTVIPLEPTDPLLAGAVAVLDRDLHTIWVSQARSPESARFDIAHELAHWALHPSDPLTSECTVEASDAEVPVPYGDTYIMGYSPAQRREVDANAFAAELLLPSPLVRSLHQQNISFTEVAEALGLSENVLLAQYIYALLVDRPDEPILPVQSVAEHRLSPLDGLDPWQHAAATALNYPVLVSAGPGTGKTKTLVARALFLIGHGVQPENILALTFSNRAAEEMRNRLAAVAPAAVHRMWIGTFHAFGLELLHRFGRKIGLPARFRVLDPIDAIALMERHVARLPLNDQFDLANPLLVAAELLRAISRAKDEILAPEELITYGEDVESPEDTDRLRAIAAAYAEWQRILHEEGAVDFGDLIYRPVRLLRDNARVRAALRNEYKHILVDEYQDINRASAELVRLIAGSGNGLWAVGDLRQAIYAFRGASEHHIRSFTTDFPGAQIKELGVNYRSLPRLVQVFNGLSASMEGIHQGSWTASRPGEAKVVVAFAENEEAQAEGIANAIRSFHEQGIPYREQAVLCRTNAQADDLAQRLAERSIPTFYLGNLLNRPEVRDLLCLISLSSASGSAELLRVATLPEYDIPAEEVQRILAEVDQGQPISDVLAASPCEGARKLAHHLNALASCHDAYDLLRRYLFQISRYLDPLLQNMDVASQQKRTAIYQLLTLAANESKRRGAASGKDFLAHLRRLAATGEDVRARTPCISEHFDAVRILTVHAAKGTEFRCVYVANLAEDLFPIRPRYSQAVLPGMQQIGDEEQSRNREEARLFFVAASRARDHLYLCCPCTVRGRSRSVSPLLSRSLPGVRHLSHEVHWSAPSPPKECPAPAPKSTVTLQPVAELSLRWLDLYLECPRRYYYQRVLTGDRLEPQTTAMRVAHCVRQTLERVYDTLPVGQRTPDVLELLFQEVWSASELVKHPASERLRERALVMTLNAARIEARPMVLKTQMDGCLVRVRADHFHISEGCAVVERWRFSLGPTRVTLSPGHAVMRRAAAETLGGSKSVRLMERDLYRDTLEEIPEPQNSGASAINKYRQALNGIRQGHFEANPANPTRCPFCPFYFACPA